MRCWLQRTRSARRMRENSTHTRSPEPSSPLVMLNTITSLCAMDLAVVDHARVDLWEACCSSQLQMSQSVTEH